MDLRLEKSFLFGGRELSLVAEALNIFDYENYDPGSHNGIIPAPGQPPNDQFGVPTALIEPGRRLQFGVSYSL